MFWYCHKRGREVRLEKERLLTESEIAKLDDGILIASHSVPIMTDVPEGARMDEVEAGILASHADGNEAPGSTSRTKHAEGRFSADFGRDKHEGQDVSR